MNLENLLPSKEEGAQMINDAIARDGVDAIREVAPLAFTARVMDGVELDQADSFLHPTVEIAPTINPLFHALMVHLGATPNGLRTYEVAAGKEKDAATMKRKIELLQAIMEVLPGGICYPPNCVEDGQKNGFAENNIRRYKVFHDLYYVIRSTPAGEEMERAGMTHMTADHPTEGPLAGAAIVISASKGRVFIKVCTNKIKGQDGLYLSSEPGTPDLDRLRPGGKLEPQQVTPDRAVSLLEEAAQVGYAVIDSEGQLGLLRRVLSDLVIAQRVPGSPGRGRLVVGNSVKVKLGEAEDRLGERSEDSATRSAMVPAAMAGAAVTAASKAKVVSAIDEQVADVIQMAQAKPVKADPKNAELRLRDYQREAVGLHLSTDVGFLQCCSVGLGKTAITLRGMRAWAEKKQAESES